MIVGQSKNRKLRPKDLEKGDIYWVRWMDRNESLIVFDHMSVSNNDVWEMIASTNVRPLFLPGAEHFMWTNQAIPNWPWMKGYKKISVRDLPLYIFMVDKNSKFDTLLKGA
jgi:hypothetical protein